MARGSSTRQNLDTLAEEPVEVLARRPSRAQRDRSWEAEQRRAGVVVTYRGIPVDVQRQIRRIADDLGVPVGEVVRRFLEFGIEAYRAGDLTLQPVFAAYRRTLYPWENAGRGK
jgi:hypothetical protein